MESKFNTLIQIDFINDFVCIINQFYRLSIYNKIEVQQYFGKNNMHIYIY